MSLNYQVELAYTTPSKQWIESVTIPAGASVRDVIEASNLWGEIDLPDIEALNLGIFSRSVSLTDPVSEGDRVEIYRPLLADPKQKRRLKSKK